MIPLLESIAATIAAIGDFVLWALVTFANSMFAAVTLALAVALALLPTMSDAPAFGTPTWLRWLNWFFPVSALLAGLVTLVAMYAVFLVVRYVLRLVRMM